MTTENSKHIGEQPLPDTGTYKGKKMSLYNCPKCDSTVAHLTKKEDAMEKAIPTVVSEPKEPKTLNYAEINKPKPKPEVKPLDYGSKEMKRDPKKDPNWKQGADKAKMDNHTKNNPNISKGINDQHYVGPKPIEKSEDLEKGLKGDWQKEGYTIKPAGKLITDKAGIQTYQVHAFDPKGEKVGHYEFEGYADHPVASVTDSRTKKEHQRKGIATAAYQMAEKMMKKELSPGGEDDWQTPAAKQLWAQKNRPFGLNKSLDGLQKAALPSSTYNNEVEAKIANIKEKYAPKGPLTMEDKVNNLKDRYHKLDKPEEIAPGADTNSTEDLQTRHKIQKLHSRHRAVKSV